MSAMYTYSELKNKGLSLSIKEPTNITRNDGQIAQNAWIAGHPATTYIGKNGFGDLMSCMEIDWGNVNWNGTEINIQEMINGDGLKNIKSSYDVLKILFWCYNKINNIPEPTPEAIYITTDKTTLSSTGVTNIYVGSTNESLLDNLRWNKVIGGQYAALDSSAIPVTLKGNNVIRPNLTYEAGSISNFIISNTNLKANEEIDAQIIATNGKKIQSGISQTVIIEASAGDTPILPSKTLEFNVEAPEPSIEEVSPSYEWSFNVGDYEYVETVGSVTEQFVHIRCKNVTEESKSVTLKCKVTWSNGYSESSSRTLTIKGKTEDTPQPEKTLSIIAKYNNENITSTLLPYNAKIDLIAEYSDGSEISDNITWTIVQGSDSGNRANLGATSDSNAITTTGKQTTLWSKNDYNKIINNTSGGYDGSETIGNTTLNKSDSYEIIFKIGVGYERQTTVNNTIKVECKDSTGLTSQIKIYVKGYENIIYDSSLFNNMGPTYIDIDESGSEGFVPLENYFDVAVDKYYPDEQTRGLFYYKWTFTSKYTNTSAISGKIVFFNKKGDGYDNKDIKPEFNITLSGIDEETTNYLYIGTTKPTSTNDEGVQTVNSYNLNDISNYPNISIENNEIVFTNTSGTRSKVYVLTNSDKNVELIDTGIHGTVDQADVDTTIPGCKIFSSYSTMPNEGTVIIRIS